MKIRIFKTISDDKFIITIKTQNFSQGDLDLMNKFGEPEINVGGSFTGPPAFTLINKNKRVMSDFPHTQIFDGADFNDAEARADVYGAELTTTISTAITTLRANTDTFSDEQVTQV